MSKDNTLDEQIDIRRYANRIRDAYTLTEAQDILKQLIESVCMEVIGNPITPNTESIKLHNIQESQNRLKKYQVKTLQTILGIRSGK